MHACWRVQIPREGKQVRQDTRPMGCGAKINACVQYQKDKWCVHVTTVKFEHTHEVSKRTYDPYSSTRAAWSEEMVHTINLLRQHGAKKTSIQRYIVQHSSLSPTLKDIANLIVKLKKREKGPKAPVELLHEWMREFCEEEPGNVGRVFSYVVDQKVFSFMAHDVFGKGQYVQHTILQNEQSETIRTAIETSKKNNPAWKRVQCVIIDKDFTEIKVLRVSMPQARILPCQFHVIKWLWEEIAEDRYRITTWQKDRLRSVVKLLVYAKSQREYMRHLLKLAPGQDCNATNWTDLDDNANWDSCHNQWCSYTRQNAITLSNNTNNRLEASWKHLKETVDAFMTVDECIACIMYYQSMMEKDYYALLYKLSVVRNAAYDTEMDRVLNLVSETSAT
uniref:Uncharacterized protein AlNc14C173G8070 n=1 Tax=Albugo laibachii Nc14 TaxID=890382 RepID=F0WNQ0_9STRA|nr:hypothetical protein PITG_23301 [Albugo laibachii Nc14]|eukprot:CCA22941.1 hypothetical protein PITG_23301 [Albugo laibachii Nc14]